MEQFGGVRQQTPNDICSMELMFIGLHLADFGEPASMDVLMMFPADHPMTRAMFETEGDILDAPYLYGDFKSALPHILDAARVRCQSMDDPVLTRSGLEQVSAMIGAKGMDTSVLDSITYFGN